MSNNNDAIVSRIFLRSALPLSKVISSEQAKFKKRFPKEGVMQFSVKDSDVGAYMIWEDGELDVKSGNHPSPDVNFAFRSLAGLCGFFAGSMGFACLPVPKGLIGLPGKTLKAVRILAAAVPLLLKLKLLMPDAIPKQPEERALKVKLLLYMVTNALSQLNKGGDVKMTKLTKDSPDRIYQWIVKDGPAAYLRVKNGSTKSGRGIYKKRRPFVLMEFPDMEGAFKVLTSEVPLVEAVKLGYVKTEGAMEYSKEIGLQMQRIEVLTTSYA